MEVSIQEKLLSTLDESLRNSLINSQVSEAKGILKQQGKSIDDWKLVTFNLHDLIPTQQGDDYNNASSDEDAKQYEKVKSGIYNIDEIRLKSFRPICVEFGTLKIIDGNHRHSAITKCGEKLIYAMLCIIKSLE
ncbi:MAG: hypothetical protein H7321_04825 [Bacteroidia bacterium]|nr:hypothetical protein [Bacteroidia bacterium]